MRIMRKSVGTMAAMAAVLSFSPAVSSAAAATGESSAAVPAGYLRFCNTGGLCANRPPAEGAECINIDIGGWVTYALNRSDHGHYVYWDKNCGGTNRVHVAPGEAKGGIANFQSYKRS